MKEASYKVQGMTCQGCVASVTRALEGALGQTKIAVSLQDGLARISGEHDPAAVQKAVESAGFDYGGPA